MYAHYAVYTFLLKYGYNIRTYTVSGFDAVNIRTLSYM